MRCQSTAQQDTADTDRIRNQIEYKQVGVQLSVTPHVIPRGLVQMRIDQQVSHVLEDVGPLRSPSLRNPFTSNVAVRLNRAVVLGGLPRTTPRPASRACGILRHPDLPGTEQQPRLPAGRPSPLHKSVNASTHFPESASRDHEGIKYQHYIIDRDRDEDRC